MEVIDLKEYDPDDDNLANEVSYLTWIFFTLPIMKEGNIYWSGCLVSRMVCYFMPSLLEF